MPYDPASAEAEVEVAAVAPGLRLVLGAWPLAATAGQVVEEGFRVGVAAPEDADVPDAFVGFESRPGNPGNILVLVPERGWVAVGPGEGFVERIGTVPRGEARHFSFDLIFESPGSYTVDIICGCDDAVTDRMEGFTTRVEAPPPPAPPWWEQTFLGLPLWAWILVGAGGAALAAIVVARR